MEPSIGYTPGLCIKMETPYFQTVEKLCLAFIKKIYKELYGKYELLGEYADMHDLLESRVIEGRSFAEVIMDDYTELLGQD